MENSLAAARFTKEIGKMVYADDMDDVPDGPINKNTPWQQVGIPAAPHHWTLGAGLWALGAAGERAVLADAAKRDIPRGRVATDGGEAPEEIAAELEAVVG